MTGMSCEVLALERGPEGTGCENKNDTAYQHIEIVAPEILEALEGRLAIDSGEIAACFDFYKPFYPKRLGDLLNYADRPLAGNPMFTGSVNLPEPLYLGGCDTYIFCVERFANSRSPDVMTEKKLEEFIDRERKSFFSPLKKEAAPFGYKLCFCVVILKRTGTSTVAMASIAKREH
jgi:hypothetical protein